MPSRFVRFTKQAAQFGGLAFAETDYVMRVKKISINSAPTGTEQDSGWDLPVSSVVTDVFVNVRTAEVTGATKTLDVGTLTGEAGGDPDGFLDGVDVSAVGIKRGSLASAGQTLGALLREDESGAGALVPNGGHVVGTARSVSYTSGSAFTEFRGDIYITYFVLE